MLEIFDSEARIKESLREIKTPFGIIYIDNWGDDVDRECKDRITLYDSRKDWLDYFSLDYFYDVYDEDEMGTEEEQALEAYERLVDMLRAGGEQQTIEGFMDWLGINFYYAGTDKVEAAKALSEDHLEDLLPDEIETNEYVNHIGDYYIVVADI